MIKIVKKLSQICDNFASQIWDCNMLIISVFTSYICASIMPYFLISSDIVVQFYLQV